MTTEFDTCPHCGVTLTESFIPGDPPVHEGPASVYFACRLAQKAAFLAEALPAPLDTTRSEQVG